MTNSENAENKQTTPVAPAPETPTPQVETKVETAAPKAEPTEKPVENKSNAAFAAMRRKNRELQEQVSKLQQTTPAPAPVVTAPVEPKPEVTVTAPAPVQVKPEGIEAESEKAILELGTDKDLAKIPGAVYDVVNLVDTDPRLARLHSVDPTLAFREAKSVYLSKAGITEPPPVPKSSTPSGGMGGESNDLKVLFAEYDKHTPGSKEANALAKKINAEMKRKGL